MDKENLNRLTKIFLPYAKEAEDRVRGTGVNFVHYTSAENAMSIIQNREIWMRESSCMNDFREVIHGVDCVKSFYNNQEPDSVGTKFRNVLDRIFNGITKEIEKKFNDNLFLIQSESYLLSFSEHDAEKENDLGRLSMWRSYSTATGVGIVFNTGAPLNDSGASGAHTMPVDYLTDVQLRYLRYTFTWPTRSVVLVNSVSLLVEQGLFLVGQILCAEL